MHTMKNQTTEYDPARRAMTTAEIQSQLGMIRLAYRGRTDERNKRRAENIASIVVMTSIYAIIAGFIGWMGYGLFLLLS